MILVTGASGIVGSQILQQLLNQGERVRILMRSDASLVIDRVLKDVNAGRDRIEWIQGDLLDPVSISKAVEGCSVVYHCAALVSFDQKKAIDMQFVNVKGTANIVDSCLKHKVDTLCYISSTAAIGDEKINGKLSEESKWTTDKGRSAYSLSKRSAEFQVWRGREEGLNAVILNPAVVIGSGNWGQSSTTLITSCKKGMLFYPPGGNGFVSASDVAKFAIASVEQKRFDGQYLLVSESLSFKSLFTLITKKFGSQQPKIKAPNYLLRMAQGFMHFVESLGLNIFSLSSENISSARRTVVYSNERALGTGFIFQSIEEAVQNAVTQYLDEH